MHEALEAPPPRGRRRGILTILVSFVAVGTLVGALIFTASNRSGAVAPAAAATPTKPTTPPAPPLALSVTPGDNAADVRLNTRVVVRAGNGLIGTVSVVSATGKALTGATAADSRSWTSSTILQASTSYRVLVNAIGPSGAAVQRQSTFRTLTPAGRLLTSVTPFDGATVGVGSPIVVRFSVPMPDRAAAVKRLKLTMSRPVTGAWRWFGSREVHYRPRVYWPTGERVTLGINIAGLDAGQGIWGQVNRSVSFAVGAAHISTVDVAAHTMTVTSGGKVLRVLPASTGRDKYPTMGGTHITLDKAAEVTMDSATVGIPRDSPDGYYEKVQWDVRISAGGEYVHAAPWSLSAQGQANVSHGCVNLSTDNAKWFYELSQPGDIVRIVGSSRPPDGDPGVADWSLSWEQWVAPATT